jgi:hydrogenase/urease accessory protein HupE
MANDAATVPDRFTVKFHARLTLSLVLGFLVTSLAYGHESRPAYLEISESTQNVFEISWRRPALGDKVLSMQPVFPAHCALQGKVANYLSSGAHVSRWSIRCAAPGLIDQSLSIDGLAQTLTDVLVRLQFLDGTTRTRILKPNATAMTIEGTPSTWQVIANYTVLGVEHILGGIDHLLFVLCLLLIVRGNWLLVKTITAFTVAHSITLAIATLGLVDVPQAPIEAVIALSILFLAVELVKQQQGKVDIAMRSPWIVAFMFGLLHGFGFAGALTEIGLPQTDIPLALLTFNAGVEIGQLLFIAVVLVVIGAWKRLVGLELSWLPRNTAYVIGTLSVYWVISRVALF